MLNQQIQNYNTSITQYEQCILRNPRFIPAHFNLAFARSEMISFINSLGDYSSVVKIKEDKDVYDNQPKSSQDIDYNDAISDYNKVIRLDPSFSFAYYNRGTLKAYMKDFEEAMDDFDKAIKENNSLGEAYFNKGLVLLYLKKHEEGCKNISKSGELGIEEAYNVIKRYCKKD
jgi:tetratricopeptide (TPR) repeat protein